eukprot:s6574_g2.t1
MRILFTSQLALVTLWWRFCLAAEHQNQTKKYCIIGAGPAGVQLGHFLFHANRDYVILETQARAGSFFEKYPRHRQLISLNKRKVREGRSAEFAFRHDWNSLIDVREPNDRTPPVTERSKELFPHASVLVEYLQEFAKEQRARIEYNSSVQQVRRGQGGAFEVKAATPEGSRQWRCAEVIVATGLAKPRLGKLRVDGAAHVLGYEDLPSSGESFEGQAVIILGQGNAALETAQELQRYTSEVHIFSRARALPDGGKGVRFAYQTHYVGDIRAGRTTILDTYLLKSLDTFDFDAFESASQRLTVVPCENRLCVWAVTKEECNSDRCRQMHDLGGQNLSYMVEIATVQNQSALHMQLKGILNKYPDIEKKTRWKYEELDFFSEDNKFLSMEKLNKLGIDPQVFQIGTWNLQVSTSILRANPQLAAELAQVSRLHPRSSVFLSNCLTEPNASREGWMGRGSTKGRNACKASEASNGCNQPPDKCVRVPVLRSRLRASQVRQVGSHDNLRYPMDHVIRCFGWTFDADILDESLKIELTHNRKYPKITSAWEVQGIPGMYAAGTLSHSLDFRKSAGGFIHGFRYTSRALFRLLEERNFNVPWPQISWQVPLAHLTCGADGDRSNSDLGLEPLLEMLLSRINSASGPYQMFEFLGDMVLFEIHPVHLELRYLEEVPLRHFHARYKSMSRLTWVFRYSDSFHGQKVLGDARVGATRVQDAHRSNFLHPMLAFFPPGAVNATMRHWLVEDVFTQWRAPDDRVPLSKFLNRVVASVLNLTSSL